MSATNAPIPLSSLEAERRSHEPSMEEILASIRRIIADDGTLPVLRRDQERDRAADARPTHEAPSSASNDPEAVEEAPFAEPDAAFSAVPAAARERETLVAGSPAAAALEPQDYWLRPANRVEPAPPKFAARDAREAPRSWVDDADAAHADRRDEAEPGEAAPSEVGGRDGGEEAAASLADAHETGASLVSADAAASVASHFQALAASMVLSESDFIARYAQEMLRPLLKQWLDDNLPVLVERLVRAEIERVARGRR